MSTNSSVGFQSKNGKAKGIYIHSDGQIEGVGEMLFEHYKDAEKVKALVELGSISTLAPEIGIKHPWDIPSYWNSDCTAVTKEYQEYDAKYGNMVRAYHRDREESWEHSKPSLYKNAEEFWSDGGERWEFQYLFSAKTGLWQCRKDSGIIVELTPKVIAKAKEELAARIAKLQAEDKAREMAHGR